MTPLPSSDFGLEFQLHRSSHVNPVIGFLPVDDQRTAIEDEIGTAVGELRPGGAVNLEIDLLARYVARQKEEI